MSFVASAIYSDVYDKELEDLSIVEPKKALSIAQQNLFDTELRSDTSGQLVALYYILKSLSILSKSEALDKYLSKGLTLAEQTNNSRFKVEFLSYRAIQNELKGNFQAALADANQAVQYTREIDDDRLLAQTISIRGKMQIAIGNDNQALEDIKNSLIIFLENHDNANISNNYNLLAIAHSSFGDFDNALKFYQESEQYDKIKSPYFMSISHYNMGAVNAVKKNYEQAIEHFTKAMKFSKQVNDEAAIAFVQYGLANIYLLQKNSIKAEETLYPTFKIFKLNNDTLMIVNAYLLMAEIQISKKNYPESLMYINLAEKLVTILDTRSIHLYYLKQKIKYFEAQGMWKEAFGLTKKVRKIHLEEQKKKDKDKIFKLRVRFNAEFDEKKMKLIQHSIKQEKKKFIFLIGLMSLAFLAIVMVYFLYRSQRKIKKTLFYLGIESELVQMSSRRETLKILRNSHEHSQLQQEPFALIMIDLDQFKKLNDAYGITKGNQVMIHFARVAKNIMPANSLIGRLGGQEWLLTLPHCDNDGAKAILKQIREVYNVPQLVSLPLDYPLYFSSGVIICDQNCTDVSKVMKLVDEAMYQAKTNGKNQDVFTKY